MRLVPFVLLASILSVPAFAQGGDLVASLNGGAETAQAGS
jgi:hypothetical protein